MYEILNTIQNTLNIVVWGNIFYTFYATIKGWDYGERIPKRKDSHIDWWIYENSNPEDYFEKIEV